MQHDIGRGTRLHVTRSGRTDGPLLLAIPPVGFDSRLFDGAFETLGRVAEIVTFDLTHNGRSTSSTPLAEVTHDTWLDEALGLLDALGRGRAVLFGHSYGGFLALELALKAPERVAGLVLLSTTAVAVPPPVMLERLKRLPPNVAAAVLGAFSRPFANDDDLRAAWRQVLPAYLADRSQHLLERAHDATGYHAAAINHALGTLLPRYDVRARLAEIKAPTLVLVGDQEWHTNVEEARVVAEGIAGAKLHVFDRVAHYAYLEDNEAFTDTVLAWLRGALV